MEFIMKNQEAYAEARAKAMAASKSEMAHSKSSDSDSNLDGAYLILLTSARAHPLQVLDFLHDGYVTVASIIVSYSRQIIAIPLVLFFSLITLISSPYNMDGQFVPKSL